MPPRRDPNKPKGRTSAYAFFVQHRRDEYKRDQKPIHFAEFSKECADKWKHCMSDKDKKHFHEQAETDRKRYKKEMADYKPIALTDGGRRRRKKKDPNMPKRSM